MDPIPLVGVGVFLLSSALFSGYETAFFSLSPAQLNDLIHRHPGRVWVHWIRYFSEVPEILLSVILIGNTLVNLGTTLLLLHLGRQWGPSGEAIAAGVALALLILIGEIIPKSLAITQPIAFLQVATPLIQVSLWATYPVSWYMDKLRRSVERRWQTQSSPESLTRIVETIPTDLSPPAEKRILKNLLLLRQLPVKAFMVSRMDMKALPYDLPWQKLKTAIAEVGLTRIPIYKDSLDNIQGVLLVKELLPHWDKEELSNWQALLRKVHFVPENKNAYEHLLYLKNHRFPLSIVVDEFGSVAGVVSLQRLLEVIFGYEEEDRKEQRLYEVYADGSICFQAHVPLLLVQELLQLPVDFFSEEEARSAENLAEFLLSLAERIPAKGETLIYRDYAFEVLEGTAHRIERVRAYRRSLPGSSSPSSESLSASNPA
ncbi:MAG: CNNM domain-containing protein [Bacteroidia bacterium]|nr:CNNM domain-containing protein [Bacteroidia bacterium]MDW8235350.1 CNNM domain-containing protein [Bacteroidia bacterium]